MKIPGCATGNHSDVKLERSSTSSGICSNAPERIIVNQIAPEVLEVKNIPSSADTEYLVPFKSTNGYFKCRHSGCGSEYDPDQNGDTSCSYHSGKAGFRDTRKFWSCCGASSYDWDEFMRIPTCCVGPHEPKLVPGRIS